MGRELKMETALASQIANEQLDEISHFERIQFPDYERRFSIGCEMCADANPRYNCHGMTFASRRTGIFESDVLARIIREDGYEEIQKDRVRGGDVIVYFDDAGDFEHSGIVIEPPRQATLYVPTIRSKWAKYKELIHPANQSPYNFSKHKYFRITR